MLGFVRVIGSIILGGCAECTAYFSFFFSTYSLQFEVCERNGMVSDGYIR